MQNSKMNICLRSVAALLFYFVSMVSLQAQSDSKQAQLAQIRKMYAEAKAQAANSNQSNETVVTSNYSYHGEYDEHLGSTFFTPYLIIRKHNAAAEEYYEEFLFDKGALVFYFSKQGANETRYFWGTNSLLTELIKGERQMDEVFAARLAGDLKEAFNKLLNREY